MFAVLKQETTKWQHFILPLVVSVTTKWEEQGCWTWEALLSSTSYRANHDFPKDFHLSQCSKSLLLLSNYLHLPYLPLKVPGLQLHQLLAAFQICLLDSQAQIKRWKGSGRAWQVEGHHDHHGWRGSKRVFPHAIWTEIVETVDVS